MVASTQAAIFNCQCDQTQNCEGGCETIYVTWLVLASRPASLAGSTVAPPGYCTANTETFIPLSNGGIETLQWFKSMRKYIEIGKICIKTDWMVYRHWNLHFFHYYGTGHESTIRVESTSLVEVEFWVKWRLWDDLYKCENDSSESLDWHSTKGLTIHTLMSYSRHLFSFNKEIFFCLIFF